MNQVGQSLQWRGPIGGFPPKWIIYRWPRDFPDVPYIVRVWYGDHATDEAVSFDDLATARKAIMAVGGSARLLRHPEDDPGIVEVWL